MGLGVGVGAGADVDAGFCEGVGGMAFGAGVAQAAAAFADDAAAGCGGAAHRGAGFDVGASVALGGGGFSDCGASVGCDGCVGACVPALGGGCGTFSKVMTFACNKCWRCGGTNGCF